jgi:hypothetical protein
MASDGQRGAHAVLTLAGMWALVWIDLRWLHAGWMDLLFPHQRDPHPVAGTPTPQSRTGMVAYRLWGLLGAAVVLLLYPVVVAGFAVRYYARRLHRGAAALGAWKLLVVTGAVWGALTVVAYLRSFPTEGVVAVAAGGSVAAVSAVLALTFARWGGRATTVLVAAPLGVTAIFLPPVVAALYSSVLAAHVFPASTLLAVWLLDGPLAVGGLAATLRAEFDLVGLAYVGMWFGLAVPVGWALGLLVTVADVVRDSGPTGESDESGQSGQSDEPWQPGESGESWQPGSGES